MNIHTTNNTDHTNNTDTTSTPGSTRGRSGVVRSAKAVVAIAVAMLTMAAATGTASAASWVYADRNYDGYYDAAGIDSNYDGHFDVIWIDSDYNRTWDLLVQYQGRWTGFHSVTNRSNVWAYVDGATWLYFDLDGNGRYERVTYDANSDGRAEWALIDNNGDGYYDGNWVALNTWNLGTATIGGGGSGGLTNNVLVNQLILDHNKAMVDIWLR